MSSSRIVLHTTGLNYSSNIYHLQIPLGGSKNFIVHQFVCEDPSRTLVKEMFVSCANVTIAHDYLQCVEFFTLLECLVKKNPIQHDNQFFKEVKKTENGRTMTSLQCLFDPKKYIGPAEARVMTQIYNESKIGLSFRSLLIGNETHCIKLEMQRDEMWSKIFKPNGMDEVIETVKKNGVLASDLKLISKAPQNNHDDANNL
ncbi:MAG: hypothetical protein JXK05_05305 [Campylobacterales bacterium]|nr:hypothetical protein [Campylobacterales bacterium]